MTVRPPARRRAEGGDHALRASFKRSMYRGFVNTERTRRGGDRAALRRLGAALGAFAKSCGSVIKSSNFNMLE
jgi:hypothetical protein